MVTTKKSRTKAHNKKTTLALLTQLGWTYLPPQQALEARNHTTDKVLLPHPLKAELQKRTVTLADKCYPLSEKAIDNIIDALSNPLLNEGLLAANEHLHNQLVYGIAITEYVAGKQVTTTVALIDWHNPANNSYVFTDEFSVTRAGGVDARCCDFVCFVNGIPLAVIEAKLPSGGQGPSIAAGISKSLRNQRPDEIPQLFAYSQLLISINGNDARYGTCGTPAELWARWREEDISDAEMLALKNNKIRVADDNTAITTQDQLLIGLLCPARLLEMTRLFTLFDRKLSKLVARFQQVFGVKRLLERISSLNPDGGRQGGVIWHSPDFGKSLTTVFLCKALMLQEGLTRCRLVIVSERETLETLLSDAVVPEAKLGGKKNREVVVATSGRRLAAQIGKGTERIMFSLPQKLHTAIKLPECENLSADMIVVIDDSFDWWISENQRRMKRVLPNASFVVVTGTPLENQAEITHAFGPIVHSYSLQNAIADKTEVTLLYEECWSRDQNNDISLSYTNKDTACLSSGVQENVAVYTPDKTAWEQDPLNGPDDRLQNEKDLLLNEIPDVFGGNRNAQAYFCVVKKVLPEAVTASDSMQSTWIKLAFEIDDVVAMAVDENSINRLDAEADIRKKLLPMVFQECKAIGGGLEQAKSILDGVLEVSRLGL